LAVAVVSVLEALFEIVKECGDGSVQRMNGLRFLVLCVNEQELCE
jgi:hypothetical protein